jgi:tetratricopeptide (TPR) repeat protein
VGELAPAITLFRGCVTHFESELDTLQYIRFACLLSCALTDAGEFVEAEQVVARALAHATEISDPYARARLYWSQSRLLLEQGRSDLAERYARNTLDTLKVTGDNYALAHARQSLAEIYLDLGRAHDAARELKEAEPSILAAATPFEVAHFRLDEARALAALGQGESAIKVALAAIVDLNDALPIDKGRAYLLVSQILDRAGDEEQALALASVAVDALEQGSPSRYLVEAYRHLGTLLRRRGESDQALDVLERAVSAQERARRPLG